MKPNFDNLINKAFSIFNEELEKHNHEAIKAGQPVLLAEIPIRHFTWIENDFIYLTNGINICAKYWISRERFVVLKPEERKAKFYRKLEARIKQKTKYGTTQKI